MNLKGGTGENWRKNGAKFFRKKYINFNVKNDLLVFSAMRAISFFLTEIFFYYGVSSDQ